MSMFKQGWYLIYTRPRHEKKVHNRLNEMNIASFLPVRKRLQTLQDRKKIINEPLFPSYVFIYLNDMQNYYDGIDADGSLHYVKTGKEIAMVRESVVNNIKLLVNEAEDLEISDKRFMPGQRLVISQGSLTGLSCEIVQSDNKEKLLVRVDLLQRNILLSVPKEHLIAL
jgi:transcriptional antiterminator RfaH